MSTSRSGSKPRAIASDSQGLYGINQQPNVVDVRSRQLLLGLWLDGALTTQQVDRLLNLWPDVRYWAADPYFGTVREHTRAYIQQAANRCRPSYHSAIKEMIPHV